jgi:hypothetical protein
MHIFPLLCGGELGKDSHSFFLGRVVVSSRSDNLSKVIMEALMISLL